MTSDKHASGTPSESLSALMDGETTEFELHQLLKQAGESDDLRETWSRMHVAQSVMKGDAAHSVLQLDIADRVRQSLLEDDSAATHPASSFVARLAIAASVAAVTFFTADALLEQDQGAAAVAQQTPQPITTPYVDTSGGITSMRVTGENSASDSVISVPAPVLTPEVHKERIQNYMIYHMQQSTSNDNRGMMPMVRTTHIDDE